MAAYYNEIDAYPAQWLRNLIAAGHIAPGDVDERSIVDVRPDDLRDYEQCHFFAGIGVWSYALRSARWPDDRLVWTGSCPCQPFSAAGKGDEFADERHLWPAWFRLARELRPVVIFGEQVASRDALAWLDHVCADLEGEGYAVGAVDSCAAGYGAPHIRQRLYFVAESEHIGHTRSLQASSAEDGRRAAESRMGDSARGLAESDGGNASAEGLQRGGEHGLLAGGGGAVAVADSQRDGGRPDKSGRRQEGRAAAGRDGAACELADADRGRQQQPDAGERGVPIPDASRIMGDTEQPRSQGHAGDGDDGHEPGRERALARGSTPTAGFWRDAIWLPCRDGKARPAKPGIFPLAHGAAARVGRLRAYGNCICAPQAAEFVRAYMECRP